MCIVAYEVPIHVMQIIYNRKCHFFFLKKPISKWWYITSNVQWIHRKAVNLKMLCIGNFGRKKYCWTIHAFWNRSRHFYQFTSVDREKGSLFSNLSFHYDFVFLFLRDKTNWNLNLCVSNEDAVTEPGTSFE